MKMFNAFLVSIFMTAFIAAQTNYEPGVLLLCVQVKKMVLLR